MKNTLGILIFITLATACNSSKNLVSNSTTNQEVEMKPDNSSVAGGPPTIEQLTGTWKMIEWPKSEMNKVNPWPLPFQWFYFDKNGKVYSMMNTDDSELTSKDIIEIFDALPSKSTPNYKLSGQFLTIDNPEIENYQELWGVNIFLKDVKFIQQGDVVMSLDDGNGAPVYYRLLRKIK